MKQVGFSALVRKEFRSYINSSMAYVVMVPFLLISMFMYFRTAFVLGDANLRPFVQLLPWFLVVIGPALAMRSFSEEFRRDTIELLFAHPVSEWQIAGAKLVGLVGFFGVLLFSTITLPLTVVMFSTPDVGLMVAQYLGAFLVGMTFLAVGLAASAFLASSVGSFLVGAAINFSLMLVGLNFVVLAIPAPLNRVFIELGISSHVENVSRGVIDIRDLLYFGTVVGLALVAAVLRLSERKLLENQAEKKKLWVIMALVVGIGVAGNVLMAEYPIRLDLTSSRRFSLSRGTKQLLKELPDVVTVTLYASNNLPGPMQVTLQETSDRMKDFARFGDKLRVDTVVVGTERETRDQAVSKGIREVQFNQVGAGSFAVQTGFLGIHLRYADKTEVIDFVDDAADLEYQLSRLILKMTRDTLPQLGLLNAASGIQTNQLYSILSDQYSVQMLDDTSTDDWKELAAVVVLDDGSSKQATATAQTKQFVVNGGNVLAFIEGVNVNEQALLVSPTKSEMQGVFSDFGVTVMPQLLYDLQLNEPISMGGQGGVQYIVNYPFWTRSLVNRSHTPWGGATNNVLLGWPATLNLSEQVVSGEYTVKPLLITSNAAGVQQDNFIIEPAMLENLDEPTGTAYTTGALIEKGTQRMLIVADTTMVSDSFLQNTAENQTFLANAVDWVAADEVLASIPKRTSERMVFTFASKSTAAAVQYGNILMPPLAVALFGGWWLKRRKKLAMRQYAAEK